MPRGRDAGGVRTEERPSVIGWIVATLSFLAELFLLPVICVVQIIRKGR